MVSIFVVAVILTCFQLSFQSEVGDKFSQESINSDLRISSPEEKCEVLYNSDVVNLGNELNPDNAASQPSHISWPTKPNKLYTVVLVDPDAPSRKRPTSREWRHWVVSNIPGKEISRGEPLTNYNGPSPPSGSGLHRYVFLVYEQRDKISSSEDLGDRGNWKVADFAKKHNLNLVAGNFFQVRIDKDL